MGRAGGALRLVAQFIPHAPDRQGLGLLDDAVDLGFLFGLIGVTVLVAPSP